MDREQLIREVKNIYAHRADQESRAEFIQGGISPEAYYENLLNQVLAGIDAGRFDSFHAGQEIVDAIAKDHSAFGIR